MSEQTAAVIYALLHLPWLIGAAIFLIKMDIDRSGRRLKQNRPKAVVR